MASGQRGACRKAAGSAWLVAIALCCGAGFPADGTIALSNRKARETLAVPVPVDFRQVPLSDAVRQILAGTDLEVILDFQGLAVEQAGADTPVKIELRDPISRRSALLLILRPLRLDYYLRDGAIVVTSEQHEVIVRNRERRKRERRPCVICGQ